VPTAPGESDRNELDAPFDELNTHIAVIEVEEPQQLDLGCSAIHSV